MAQDNERKWIKLSGANLPPDTCQKLQTPKDTGLIQFSGLILTSDSLRPVSYTTVMVNGTKRGVVADGNGFFSLVAHKGEVIEFSAIGFQKVYFTVPDTVTGTRYNIVQLLTADTIFFAESILFPWPTFEQFKHAFVTAEIPDDALENAIKNIEIAKIKDFYSPMPNDGSMNFRQMIYQKVDRNYYLGQYPPNNLLNPLAWKKFFEAWRRGDFKRKKKN